MKFPDRPERIEDWQYAFTGKRGSLSRLADTRENYENEFKVQVERSAVSSHHLRQQPRNEGQGGRELESTSD